MRLYVTDRGIARQADGPGDLELLDLPHTDLAQLVRHGVGQLDDAKVRARFPLTEAVVLAPVGQPRRIILTGVNYASHAEETNLSAPTAPAQLFIDASPEMIIAGGTDIVLPADAPQKVDYEGELAVLIGRPGADIAAGDGWNHVAGYTVAGDITARDVQFSGVTGGVVTDPDAIVRSKAYPTFKPLGPCLITADEFDDFGQSALRTHVNGELRQSASVKEMLFDVSELIEAASRQHPLEAGDLLLTGTPGGVGFVRQSFLVAGDTVEFSVDGIGSIVHRVSAAI